MTNTEILNTVYANEKRLVTYYPYPTGGYGTDNQIAITDNFNGKQYDVQLKSFVDLIVRLAASVANCQPDDKTAVEIDVEGLDFPVYCYKHSGQYVITRAISANKVEPVDINYVIY